ncbi:hypothetical protein GCM10027294_22370 [Marinactinospora endophytica]
MASTIVPSAFAPAEPDSDDFDLNVRRFFERYGVGTMVPLREVVADSGVGYPGAPTAPRRSRLTERDEVVITGHTLAALDSTSQPRLPSLFRGRSAKSPPSSAGPATPWTPSPVAAAPRWCDPWPARWRGALRLPSPSRLLPLRSNPRDPPTGWRQVTDQLATMTATAENAIDVLLGNLPPQAVAADRRINSHRWTLGRGYEQIDTNPFGDKREALDAMDYLAPLLRGCVRIAHAIARHNAAWELCEALASWLARRQELEKWEKTHLLGLASAEAWGPRPRRPTCPSALAGA